MSKSIFKQPSTSKGQQHFSRVPSADIQRSRFDRSHGYKTTFDAGKLIPCFLDEVLPGDSFHLKATNFMRLATPLKPLMDNLKVDMHFFFVPSRLVWDDFQKFMGERPDPDFDPNSLTVPQVPLPYNDLDNPDYIAQLAQYFGLPYKQNRTSPPTDFNVNALPFRAYNLIWNEWYRDENLQSSVQVPRNSGFDSSYTYKLLPRGKRKDYFTSSLPWPQKGDPVAIPLGTSADVLIDGFSDGARSGDVAAGRIASYSDLGMTALYGLNVTPTYPSGTDIPHIASLTGTADLSSATAVTVNDLREAFQIQKLLERDARGGTRYIELILSHFGVMSDDARLQRPEFLGGGTFNVSMNPVANTAGDVDPTGELGAYATGVGSASFSKGFTEHGYIIGLMSARADLNYQQGVERLWSRRTRYDFYWPTLAHLGEQAILNKEIYLTGESGDDDVFGYQERYAEYRYKPSRITGKFNSGVSASLDVWHLAQWFQTKPVLNADFIVENPPIKRVIAVQSEPDFLCDVWFDLKCDRPMPVYSVPGLIDHF